MSKHDFAKLEPRVKHISEAAIRKKWKRLPSASHTITREVIWSAREQSKRRKRGKANSNVCDAHIQEVISELIDRLPKIPFPPGTEEQHFDYEASLNRMAKVEDQLNSNVHSMNLLRAQIQKEEALLKQDEHEAAVLEKAMRDNEVLRREQSRSLHVIARDIGMDNTQRDSLSLDRGDAVRTMIDTSELLQDESMAPIMAQLQSHLGTMQHNFSELRDVKQAINEVSRELTIYEVARLRTSG